MRKVDRSEARKNERRVEAVARQAEHDKLSTKEKYNKAFSINPKSRETARLAARLEEEKNKKNEKKEAKTEDNKKSKKKRIGKQRQETQEPSN